MMEIESFWKGIKPFKNNEKGKNGYLNYGAWRKKGREPRTTHPIHSHKRKCLRQIRRYGFDLSELWSLDCTIMSWLSDTFGGFFKICGLTDDWGDYDLDGNEYDFWIHRNDKDWHEKSRLYETTRYNSFKEHLKDLLDNASIEDKKKIADFCVPRLRKLADIVIGWPAGDDYPEFEDWKAGINDMADKLEQGTYSPQFIEYFFSLWD